MESKRIDVGILGATGMVGQQFIRQLTTILVPAGLAGGERAIGRQGLRRGGDLAAGDADAGRRPRACASRPARPAGGRGWCSRRSTRPRPRTRAGLRRSRAPRGQQRAQLPDGSARAAADPGDQRRPPGAAPVAAPRARLARRDRHQSELLDRRARDGAGAAAAVRAAVGHGHDAAGGLGRRLSRRASLDILGNVVPASRARKRRSRARRRRFSARWRATRVTPHPVVVSAQTTRVPVIDGHTESDLGGARLEPVDRRRRGRRCAAFRGRPQELGLPTRAGRADRRARRRSTVRSRGSTPSAAAA